MVLILDSSSEHIAITCEGKQDFSEIKFRFATDIDLIKCLKQIKLPISFHTCAPIFELLSNMAP